MFFTDGPRADCHRPETEPNRGGYAVAHKIPGTPWLWLYMTWSIRSCSSATQAELLAHAKAMSISLRYLGRRGAYKAFIDHGWAKLVSGSSQVYGLPFFFSSFNPSNPPDHSLRKQVAIHFQLRSLQHNFLLKIILIQSVLAHLRLGTAISNGSPPACSRDTQYRYGREYPRVLKERVCN